MKPGDKVSPNEKALEWMRGALFPNIDTSLVGEVVGFTSMYIQVRFPIDRGDGKPWLMEQDELTLIEEGGISHE